MRDEERLVRRLGSRRLAGMAGRAKIARHSAGIIYVKLTKTGS
jgi:hypothetical protein